MGFPLPLFKERPSHSSNCSTMKTLILLAVAVAVVVAAPQNVRDDPDILEHNHDWNIFKHSYNYNFKSADGIQIEAVGEQKQVGEEEKESGTVAKGSYSYPSSDGRLITVNWIADEKGYRASTVNSPLNEEDEEYEYDEE